MKTRWRRTWECCGCLRLAFVAATTAGVLAGCSGAASYKSNVTLKALGGDSLSGVMDCWGDIAARSGRPVNLVRNGALSADGVDGMIASDVDLVPMVREYFPSEIVRLQERFVEVPTLVPVATGSYANSGKTHALAIYVNEANPLEEISLPDLVAIFAKANDEAAQSHLTWGNLGLTGAWANSEVHAYGMINLRESGNPPGIVNFLETMVFAGAEMRPSVVQLSGSDDTHPLQQIADAVGQDGQGIGYGGFGYLAPGTRALRVSGTNIAESVAGTPETVLDRTYPLTRTVYLVARPDLREPERSAAGLIFETALSDAGQACLDADAAGFLPLTAELREKALSLVPFK